MHKFNCSLKIQPSIFISYCWLTTTNAIFATIKVKVPTIKVKVPTRIVIHITKNKMRCNEITKNLFISLIANYNKNITNYGIAKS